MKKMTSGRPGRKLVKVSRAGNHASRRRTAPSPPYSTKTPVSASFSRHKRKCTICLHPDHRAIDQEFIEWRSVPDISHFYGVSPRALYRHAQAAGLFPLRAQNIRFALGSLIEKVDQVEVTAESVIRAVCLLTKFTDDGRSVEPVTVRRSSRVSTSTADPAAAPAVAAAAPPPAPPSSAVPPDFRNPAPKNLSSLIVTPDDRKSA